ncbi:sulfite exporter TauE/SafE family protein [Salinimicrobium sp. TH3]|uniref:sulfite exporter TauE/SafE family protein n=1 Tax=Salinimicrobium sp. TH3 TaxID=2997342 RepID=UPI0022756174|nr:sulfite exporter TauE/SafE family protein [Salinimicrobium sp. TH3]MCY2685655.1 sulfite exporter TauE/SafE family protein [Salinimicrobium sp. TH3]
MLEYFIICLFALLASGLTFFSGFGLGTILLPVFALFFPLDISIALVAIVHFLNNLFKLSLIGRKADKKVVLKFGIPAIIAAFAGAYLLTILSETEALTSYNLAGKTFFITPLKLIIALLLFVFALFDIVPKLMKLNFDPKYLPLGGVLSGFFGGLSGHQGALRTAFLIRAGLSKEVFIGTGIMISVFIDISRLTVYAEDILKIRSEIDYSLLIAATLSAFVGAAVGNRILKKITIETLHRAVGIMLLLFSVLLAAGIV